MHALAVAGPVGLIHLLTILRAELEIAMALTGCVTIGDIDRSVIWTSGGSPTVSVSAISGGNGSVR